MAIINKAQVKFVQNGENVDKDVLNRPLNDVIDILNAAGITLEGGIIDALTSNNAKVPLSANQGRVLKGLIDGLSGLVNTNDPTLDTIQKIVDYIKQNRNTINSLGIANISGLVAALGDKSDKGHVHPMSDVNGLATALAGKSDTGHRHAPADITGLGTAATRNVGVSGGTNIPDRDAADARYARLGANVNFSQVTASSFNSPSDAKLKKDVVAVEPGKTRELAGVEFCWKNTDRKDAGVIAQHVERVLPHLVTTTEDGTKLVNYNGLIAYVLSDVSDVYDRLERLEKKLESIEI